MISNSNFTAPGIPPLPAYTQAIPEESGNATPTLPNTQTLPSNSDEMRARLHAFRKKENVQMIEVLQVGREEMPEAIKMLQREKENVIGGAGSSVSFVSSKGTAITATPGATPCTGLTNNKP